MRKEYRPIFCAQMQINDINWPTIDGIPMIERYESLDNLIRFTATVFKFRDMVKRRYVRDPDTLGRFSNKQLNDALDVWIRYTQMVNLGKEMHQLEMEGEVDASSPLAKLCPFIDEHSIMRLRGRITNANVSYDEQFPIIIPAHCHFVRFIDAKSPYCDIAWQRSKHVTLRAKQILGNWCEKGSSSIRKSMCEM